MSSMAQTITLRLPWRLGSVNCYLLEAEAGYVLIDTGSSGSRGDLLGAHGPVAGSVTGQEEQGQRREDLQHTRQDEGRRRGGALRRGGP